MALLQRGGVGERHVPRDAIGGALSQKDAKTVQDFLKEALCELPSGRLVLRRDEVYLAPEIPIPSGGIFAPGVCIGTLQKGRLVPHHHFYSAYGRDFTRQLSLSHGDARVERYLRGEEIDAPELQGENGFAAVLYEGAPLGGGKAVDGRMKNHYPKGLRLRA